MHTTFISVESLRRPTHSTDPHETLRRQVLFLLQKITQHNLQQHLPTATPTELIQHHILLLLDHATPAMPASEVASQLRISHSVFESALHQLRHEGYLLIDPVGSSIGLTLTVAGCTLVKRYASWTHLMQRFIKIASENALNDLQAAVVTILRARQHTIPLEHMCVTCSYFIPFHFPHDPVQPHYCLFLETPMRDTSLRHHCSEYRVPASQ